MGSFTGEVKILTAAQRAAISSHRLLKGRQSLITTPGEDSVPAGEHAVHWPDQGGRLTQRGPEEPGQDCGEGGGLWYSGTDRGV